MKRFLWLLLLPSVAFGQSAAQRLSQLGHVLNAGSPAATSAAATIPMLQSGVVVVLSWPALINGDCLTNNGSTLSWTPCSTGGMVYPGAGIAVSTGTAWGTSINGGSNTIVGNVGSGQAALTPTQTLQVLNSGSCNAQTGTAYTLALTDAYGCVTSSNAAAQTITVPPNSSVAFAIGDTELLEQLGAGIATLAPGTGVTLCSIQYGCSTSQTYALAGAYDFIQIQKTATDTWLVKAVGPGRTLQSGVVNLASSSFGGVTGILPVANGGSGTASPGLVAGTNVTITGSWPNQTIAASGGSSTPTDIQVFTASGTWTKPSGTPKYTRVILVGGGGGGGGGAMTASGTSSSGGSGGGSGFQIEATFPTASLGATESVTVGAGGTAGAAATVAGAGGNGGNGGNSSFGTTPYVTAFGGGYGGGGASNANSQGGGSAYASAAANGPGGGGGYGGANGGNGTAGVNGEHSGSGGGGVNGAAGSVGGSSIEGPNGGGAGGGVTTAPAVANGGGGGLNGMVYSRSSGGTGSTTTAGNGAAGANPTGSGYFAGAGGAGGGSTTTGTAGAGGAGGIGSGGGGGGSCLTGATACGAGGAGGAGEVIVITTY